MRILYFLLLVCFSCLDISCANRGAEIAKQRNEAMIQMEMRDWGAKHFPEKIVPFLEEGKLTRGDVIALMGMPHFVDVGHDGSSRFHYSAVWISMPSPSALSLFSDLPVVGGWFSLVSAVTNTPKVEKTRSVVFRFNKRKIFEYYEMFETASMSDMNEQTITSHYYDNILNEKKIASYLHTGKTRKKDVIRNITLGEPDYIVDDNWYYIFFPRSMKELIDSETRKLAMAKKTLYALSPVGMAEGITKSILVSSGALSKNSLYDSPITLELKFDKKELLEHFYFYRQVFVFPDEEIDPSVLSPEECQRVTDFKNFVRGR